MMKMGIRPLAGSRRGSVLMTTMTLMLLISFGSLMIARMVIDQQRLDNRRRDLARAYYAAQAGVALIQHWSNYPQDYTPNPNLFVMGDPANPYLTLIGVLSGGGMTITKSTLNTMGEATFTSDHNYPVGQIEEVALQPHVASDPVNCMFKVLSTGGGAGGTRRTITAYMDVSVAYIPPIPAGLISLNAASMGGNAKIHWGEAWSKSNFVMPNKSQMGYLASDPWAKYRTEGVIDFAAGGWKDGADYDDDPPTQQPGLGAYFNIFYHRLLAGTLQFPVLDYKTFKDMAMSHGRYYSTDAAGNIYRDGIVDAAHRVDFLTEFGITNRDTEPYRLYFIDTINGQPPAADGSNLATIKVSGNGKGLKGVMWMGANFDGSGIGDPPLITDAKKPDSSVTSLDKIFLEGVLYAAGTAAMSGNCGVYGSVIAQKGYVGGGTPDIFYNCALASGLILDNGDTGSRFRVLLQKN